MIADVVEFEILQEHFCLRCSQRVESAEAACLQKMEVLGISAANLYIAG